MQCFRRSTFVLGMAVATVLVMGAPAAAHDPIFLTDDQTTPDTGPYLPDGAISWALYGTVADTGDTRGFEFDLRAGEELYISLLIPNLDPELSLSDDELPVMEVTRPDGSVLTIDPVPGVIYDEPFSQTSYVTLHESREPAQAGRYQGVVTVRAPARFTVAIGEREEFGTPADRTVDRPQGFMAMGPPLDAWYSTPPGEEPVVDDDAEITVDVEAAEEALAELAETEAEQTADADDTDSGLPAGSEPSPDGGGSLTWVLPVVLVAALVVGAVVVRSRRNAGG